MVLEIDVAINELKRQARAEADPLKKETLWRQVSILGKPKGISLMSLNKDAYLFWTHRTDRAHPGYPYKQQRYRALQRTECWREAKKLLTEYFTLDGGLKCDHCKRVLIKWTMHHETYNGLNFYTPLFLEKLCVSCHRKTHNK